MVDGWDDELHILKSLLRCIRMNYDIATNGMIYAYYLYIALSFSSLCMLFHESFLAPTIAMLQSADVLFRFWKSALDLFVT